MMKNVADPCACHIKENRSSQSIIFSCACRFHEGMEFITHGKTTQGVINAQNRVIDEALGYKSGQLAPLKQGDWVLVHYVAEGQPDDKRFLHLAEVCQVQVKQWLRGLFHIRSFLIYTAAEQVYLWIHINRHICYYYMHYIVGRRTYTSLITYRRELKKKNIYYTCTHRD